MKILKGVLIFTVTLYITVVAALYTFQRSLVFPGIYRAAPGTPAESKFPMFKEVQIPTPDGLILRAWFSPPQNNLPLVIHFHGNGDGLSSAAPATLDQIKAGYGVLVTSYRGYSANPGSPSEEGIYNDGRGALNWAKQQGYENIALQGVSLGSGPATQLATEFPIKALILGVPYTSLPDVAASSYPYVPVSLLMKDRFNSIAKIAKVTAPIFIVGAGQDEIVPSLQQKKMFETANQPKEMLWLSKSSHWIFRNGAGEAIVKFLDAHFKPSPTPAPATAP